MVLVDVIRPPKIATRVWDSTLIIAGAQIIALCSQVAIPLAFSPIPITLQTLAVLLVGASLGSKRGALSLILYLGEGALGAPVFAGGGSGLPYLFGPTGGYLLGFILSAYTVGRLAEREWDRTPAKTAIAMAIGNLAIYIPGLAWLSLFVGVKRILYVGFLPFIPGDILKIMLALILLPTVWQTIGRYR